MKSFNDIRRLFDSIRIKRGKLTIGIVCLLITSLLTLVIPDLLGKLTDAIGNEGRTGDMTQLGLMLAGALLLGAIFEYFRMVIFIQISAESLTKLRQKTYSHIVKLPMRFFGSKSIGEITSRISSDIEVLRNFFNDSIQKLISAALLITGGSVMMLTVSWKLTLLVFVSLPLAGLLSKVFASKIKTTSSRLQKDTAQSNIIVQESLIDIYSVKSFTNEKLQISRFNESTDAVTRLHTRLGIFKGRFSLATQLVVSLLVITVIWVAARMIDSGELNPGQVVSFAVYMIAVLLSLSELSDVYSEVQKGLGSAESLLEIMGVEQENLGEKTDIVLSGSLKFESVSFSYPGSKNKKVLKDINFTIPEGERWALVGSSGSGKSTIASLILQMYDLDSGSIYFDQHRMDELSVADVRNHIAVVPQSSNLFSGSIRDNIMFGRLDASEEEFMETAIEASVDEFVQHLPDGYDTEVGEHGTRLSGGQRQRILLARAMLKNPKILILDEATSALDSETEMLVTVAIYLLTKRCTSLIIAHRLSTVKTADRILVMEDGEIIEHGTYDELMADERSHFRHLNFLSLDAQPV